MKTRINRPLLYIVVFLASSVWQSCQYDEIDVFPVEKTYEDPTDVLAAFRALIESSDHGWTGTLTGIDGRNFALFMRFDNEAATVRSDMPGAADQEVTYGLSIINGTAVVTFHSEEGLFEQGTSNQYTLEQSIDPIVLRGTQPANTLTLSRATADEEQAFMSATYAQTVLAIESQLETPGIWVAEVGSATVELLFDAGSKSVRIYRLDGDLAVSGGGYWITPTGISLSAGFDMGDNSFQALIWDPIGQQFHVNDGPTRIQFEPATIHRIPFHYLVRSEYPYDLSLADPSIDGAPGWSTEFVDRWNRNADLMEARDYTLGYIDFRFIPRSERVEILVYYKVGAHYYLVSFPFTLKKSVVGLFTFESNFDPDEADETKVFIYESLSEVFTTFQEQSFTMEFYYDIPQTVRVMVRGSTNANIHFTASFYDGQ